VTTIETLYSFGRPAGEIDVVQIGKAFITANHHIETEDGWMTARQAADKGHGTLLTNYTYSKFYSLRLVGVGNILLDTSVTPDKALTQTEVATMGYCFEPSTDPQQKGSLTYPAPQEASLREDQAALDKPSYSSVAQLHLMGMSSRPTSQSTPLAPKTIAQLESTTVTERAKKECKGAPNRGAVGLPATPQLDPKTGQRSLEEDGVDLDTVLRETDKLRS